MHELMQRLLHHLEDDRITLNPTKWAAFRDDFRHLLHALETHFSDGHGPELPAPPNPAPTEEPPTTDPAPAQPSDDYTGPGPITGGGTDENPS